jgi:hypothetical protein
MLDLSYTSVNINNEIKLYAEKHPSLIKFDLRSTKCSIEDVKYIETILIKKSVRQNLKDK